MKHISILIPQGNCSLTNIEGTFQILNEVNSYGERIGKGHFFKIQLAGIASESKHTNGLFSVSPNVMIDNLEKTDLIIIPAIFGEMQNAMEQNKDFIPWLIKQYNNGAEIATFCIASFFLAGTGLLKGKQSTTHWMFANEFRMMFPEVNLLDDKILTEDSGIYTSGGAYSYLNLLLYIIEKYAGRDTAIFISKTFAIDIDRNSQSPFIMFKGQRDHSDDSVKKAQEFIENNFTDRINIDQLADMLALGRRSLERRFKKATSNTVLEYTQRVKIEAAKKSFEKGQKNINEVMHYVGYSDTKAFRSIFKKHTGLSPIDYRNKYNKAQVS